MAPGVISEDYKSFVPRLGKNTNQKERWPVMTGKIVWEGSSAETNEWIYNFTPTDIEEIEQATERFLIVCTPEPCVFLPKD